MVHKNTGKWKLLLLNKREFNAKKKLLPMLRKQLCHFKGRSISKNSYPEYAKNRNGGHDLDTICKSIFFIWGEHRPSEGYTIPVPYQLPHMKANSPTVR